MEPTAVCAVYLKHLTSPAQTNRVKCQHRLLSIVVTVVLIAHGYTVEYLVMVIIIIMKESVQFSKMLNGKAYLK